MDIAEESGYIIAGHEKMLSMWQLAGASKVCERKPESVRKTGSYIRTVVDPWSSILVASCTDKIVTIFEA